jgi:SAM-dependent methyltransferase
LRNALRSLVALVFSCAFLRAAAVEEVPFITTPDNVTLAMLELAGVGPGDFVLDLGSGDGRIVILAARRFGARGLGVEIVPDLVAKSRENARNAGVADRAEFRAQDLFETDLGMASVVTMYLLPEVNLQLRPKILALAPGTRIVSHDWDMGEWKADKTITVDAPDKKIGLRKSSTVMLWTVPAPVAGLWCGKGESLEITQSFQDVRVNGKPGRIEGAAVHVADGLKLDWASGKLVLAAANARFAHLQSVTFAPAKGQPASCAPR